MSKVTISPILNSLFSRSDRMTKEEASTLCSVLSEVGGDDVVMSLAQSTVEANQKANYVIVQGNVDMGEVCEVLSDNQWDTIRTENRGLEGNWAYFVRQ